MVRVAYPAVYPIEFFRDFPREVELIPVSEQTEGTVEAEVWLPDSYPTRAQRVWPHLSGVRLVLSLMAGTEWIPSTVGPHVTICNARGAHNIATAEWTLGAILASLKHFPFYRELQQAGVWKRRFESPERYALLTGDRQPHYPPVMLEELTAKRVLLVGHGQIGQEIERMLTPFRVQLTRVARRARSQPEVHAVEDLDRLIPQAEILILILPLDESSRGLIGPKQFALMNPGTLLVNSARGPIVQTDALVEALQSGRIRAALDVTDPEPLPEGHPLWTCPNLLLTPHVAGSTPQFAPRALRTAAEELTRYLTGQPLRNVVQAAL